MKPERTLQKMYDEYPQLFPTRQQALDQLFCVIGNGYEWKKGELVNHKELYYYDILHNNKEYDKSWRWFYLMIYKEQPFGCSFL